MLRCADIGQAALSALVARFGLTLRWLALGQAIDGSYWGESEAGLVGAALLVRPDTPLHSALHEASHFICMSDSRRAILHTDAGGDDLEECAVCYLQLLLSDRLGVARQQMLADMDAWGYSFRLGSTRAWVEHDAGDARAWLIRHGIIDNRARLTWRRR